MLVRYNVLELHCRLKRPACESERFTANTLSECIDMAKAKGWGFEKNDVTCPICMAPLRKKR